MGMESIDLKKKNFILLEYIIALHLPESGSKVPDFQAGDMSSF